MPCATGPARHSALSISLCKCIWWIVSSMVNSCLMAHVSCSCRTCHRSSVSIQWFTYFHVSPSVYSINMVLPVHCRSTIRYAYCHWILSMRRLMYSFGSGTWLCWWCWSACCSSGEFTNIKTVFQLLKLISFCVSLALASFSCPNFDHVYSMLAIAWCPWRSVDRSHANWTLVIGGSSTCWVAIWILPSTRK